jgi:hypothetical protein
MVLITRAPCDAGEVDTTDVSQSFSTDHVR